MAEKPGSKTTGTTVADDEPGRLELDDRGNVTWQWSDKEDLQADDSLGAIERVRALDPGLTVAGDDQNPFSPVENTPKKLKTGYNPYNSGALGKQSWKKKKDLRELSKWIELRKKMADKKEGDE